MINSNFQVPARAAAVTPSDTTLLANTVGLYVGGAGTVTVDTEGGDTNVAFECPAGVTLVGRFIRVKATGTDATLIVRLYN